MVARAKLYRKHKKIVRTIINSSSVTDMNHEMTQFFHPLAQLTNLKSNDPFEGGFLLSIQGDLMFQLQNVIYPN
jgi:3-methyladenine DNA glycosylase Tag